MVICLLSMFYLRKIRPILFVLLTTSTSPIYSQDKPTDILIESLTLSFSEYLESYVKNDWETFVSFTHPNILEMAGGEEILVKVAEESISMYNSMGYSLKSGKVSGKIETIERQGEIQAIVPIVFTMSNSTNAEVENPIKVFAISKNYGESWKFVDLSQYDKESITQFVPEFNTGLFKYWR